MDAEVVVGKSGARSLAAVGLRIIVFITGARNITRNIFLKNKNTSNGIVDDDVGVNGQDLLILFVEIRPGDAARERRAQGSAETFVVVVAQGVAVASGVDGAVVDASGDL